MKKWIVFIAICLLLTACAHTPASPQMNSTQPTTVSTTTFYDPKPCRSPGLSIYGVDEYNEFIKYADLPEDFVHYESLTHFGEFEGLVIFSQKIDKYTAKDYSNYMYSFVDEKGTVLYLNVGPRNKEVFKLVETVESKYWGDMQTGDPTIYKQSVMIDRNGVSYLYTGNKLYIIAWETNGILFMLDTSSWYDQGFYPEDGPLTFVQELLHTDTNEAAIESFKTSLNTPAIK